MSTWTKSAARICGPIRHCTGVLELHPQWQAWAGQVRDVLREAAAAVEAAKAEGNGHLDPRMLADLRGPLRRPGRLGITTNRTATGTKAATPAITSPRACATRPNKSGYSPETSRSRGRTTHRNSPSKAPSGIRPSRDTGTPRRPSQTTAGCVPTWSAHAVTAFAPLTPSTTPSPANRGYRLEARCRTAASARSYTLLRVSGGTAWKPAANGVTGTLREAAAPLAVVAECHVRRVRASCRTRVDT